MSKINITLDVSKISKDKIISRTFKNKDGVEVTAKDYKIELIELKEPRFVKETDTWKMIKTHFVKESQTKEEREAKKPDNFVGEGFTFEEKDAPKTTSKTAEGDVINVEDIPF